MTIYICLILQPDELDAYADLFIHKAEQSEDADPKSNTTSYAMISVGDRIHGYPPKDSIQKVFTTASNWGWEDVRTMEFQEFYTRLSMYKLSQSTEAFA